MFKKLMSAVGIGAAKVDTKLSKSQYVAGEVMEGVVEIKGGNVEQRIDKIYLSLMSTYTHETDDSEFEATIELERYKLIDSFVIYPNEFKTIPFQFALPLNVPITKGKTRVWIQTGLDIKMAVDPQDRDYIHVYPHPLVDAFLQATQSLGFQLREVECEKAPSYLRGQTPVVQEFEFKPYGGMFAGRLDELEAIFNVNEYGVEVILEIDRKARGLGGFLAEAMDMDESLVRFNYSNQDVGSLPQRLADVINQYC